MKKDPGSLLSVLLDSMQVLKKSSFQVCGFYVLNLQLQLDIILVWPQESVVSFSEVHNLHV